MRSDDDDNGPRWKCSCESTTDSEDLDEQPEAKRLRTFPHTSYISSAEYRLTLVTNSESEGAIKDAVTNDDIKDDSILENQLSTSTPAEPTDVVNVNTTQTQNPVASNPGLRSVRPFVPASNSGFSASDSSDDSFLTGANCDALRLNLNFLAPDEFDSSSTDDLDWNSSVGRLMQSIRSNSGRVVNPDNRVYHNEFEVASATESEINPNPIENAESSSGDDYQAGVELPQSTDKNDFLERENFADEESECCVDSKKSDFHSDPKLERKEWPCHNCKALTTAISRYCLRCFQARRNWLPRRPKHRKPRGKSITENATERNIQIDSDPSQAGHSDMGAFCTPGPIPSSTCAAVTASSSTILTSASQDVIPAGNAQGNSQGYDSAIGSQSVPTSPAKLSQPTLGSPEKMMNCVNESAGFSTPKVMHSLCNVCLEREKDAAFVHNKIAHSYSCFSCADKILKRTGKCPICRARILRVVRIISV